MTEFTEEKLAELRAVAEAAALDFRWFDSVVIGDLLAGYTGRVEESDASEHIATFDPTTVLALIAALEAKTAEVDAKADYVSDLEERVRQRDNHVIPVLHARIKEAERERDEARARAERLTPKQPDGWSTQDRQEAKQEAERRWTDDWDGCQSDFDRGGINGFILGAEWQKARETFISYKTIADEAEAALERVKALHQKRRAYADDWDTCTCGYDEYPCRTIRALETGADDA